MYRTVIHLPRNLKLTDIRPLLVANYFFRQSEGRCLVSFEAANEGMIDELLGWFKLKDKVRWSREPYDDELEDFYQHLAKKKYLQRQVADPSGATFLLVERDRCGV